MKRFVALLLLLCLLLPAAALGEEKLPRLSFYEANIVGYTQDPLPIRLDIRSSGSLNSAKTLELRNQDGRVLATREFKPGTTGSITIKVETDDTYAGGHDLSVWCDGMQVSIDSAYCAITDKHRKAVVKVDTQQPFMSISFDCCYVDTPTDEILQILDEFGLKTTFFMAGEFLKEFPESAKKIRDAGHEIGCHSLSHPHLLSYHLDMRFKQVRRNVEMVRETLGIVPRLFRPPFGEFDVTISAPARAEGMEMCLWTIDSHDWDWNFRKEQVVRQVTKDVGPGTIILFHLDGFFTPDVLREVIPYYENTLGLTLVPITELMAIGGLDLPASPYLNE